MKVKAAAETTAAAKAMAVEKRSTEMDCGDATLGLPGKGHHPGTLPEPTQRQPPLCHLLLSSVY